MACLALPASAAAALPDLLSDPAGGAYTGEYVIGGQSRLLLRFDSYIRNAAGAGPAQVVADQKAAGRDEMTRVRQVVEGVPEPQPTTGRVAYAEALAETTDGHEHWHLLDAAEYALTTTGGELVAPAEKVGFCLLNSRRAGGAARPPDLGTCGTRTDAEVTMGIAPGWRDLYGANLDFQWVDVSRVVPGTYLLRSRVDPGDVIDEAGSELNAPSTVPVRIPGHVARPVVAPRTVELRADRVEPMTGTLDAPEFRLVTAPAHGSVDRAVGAWSSDPVVTYTPDDPADPRPDAVEYVARAAGSAFPVEPPRATASFGQGTPVGISGAPATMVAGTAVVLRAEAAGPVTWSASSGRVAPDGTYTAPDVPGEVRVRAATGDGSAAAVRIAVVAAPLAQAAPLPAGAPPGDPALVPPRPLAPTPPVALPRRAFVSARAQRIGRFVAVTVVPGRSGALRVVLRRGTRTLAQCRVRATAGRSVTCRLRAPRRGRGRLRVVAHLRGAGPRTVSRAIAVRGGHAH